MHRNIAFHLVPGNSARAEKLSMIAGACRWIWNRVLAETRQQYRFHQDTELLCEHTLIGMCLERPEKPSLTFFSLGKRFTQLRRETPWLAALPCHPVRQSLKYQADAWKRYFADPKNFGKPKFKERRGDDSFTIPQDVKIRIDSITGVRWLWVPKVGWYVLKRSGGNPYDDCPAKQAIVHRVLGRWRCTVCYEVPAERVAPIDNGKEVGLDRNSGKVAASDGREYCMPSIKRLEARKKRYDRMMQRRLKGSKRRAVARHRRAKAARKIAAVRANWHHHVSRELADRYGKVVMEALDTKAMTKSAKGTVKKPGRNVKAKTALNRCILDTGWAGLAAKLSYKAAQYIEVNAAYTSQTCHRCGHVAAESRRSQSEFQCVVCGYTGNADVNAALNILARGTGAAGRRGALASATPKNRQRDMLVVAADAAS